MRIVVTGGAGYIGSVLVEVLVGQGHDVLVYDDLSTGHREAVEPAARFVEGSLHDTARLAQALEGADAVVHMAARALVAESVARPEYYYQENVVGGLSLLNAMIRSGCRRLLFSSTAATFGEPVRQPVREEDPQLPTNPYGQTKLAFEQAVRWHAPVHGFSAVFLRYFNAAGASERHGEDHDPETHLIPRVLRAAAGLDTVTLHGTDYPTRDGTCVRDYVHVLDLADAHVRALSALDRPGVRAYNLGYGGEGHTVAEVVEAARRVTGVDFPVHRGPRRPGDPAVLVASSARIEAELGWRPQRTLDEVVGSAWRWLRRTPGA